MFVGKELIPFEAAISATSNTYTQLSLIATGQDIRSSQEHFKNHGKNARISPKSPMKNANDVVY